MLFSVVMLFWFGHGRIIQESSWDLFLHEFKVYPILASQVTIKSNVTFLTEARSDAQQQYVTIFKNKNGRLDTH